MEETGSHGIICIVSHQAYHQPSDHGTNSMGKRFLTTSNIIMIFKTIELEVSELTCSTINKTSLAILKRAGIRGITIV
jgi:hypothetical protein